MEKVDLSPWEASSLSNKVPCLLKREKGQATGDGVQASKEETAVRMGTIKKTGGHRWHLVLGEFGETGAHMYWWGSKQ